jgi:lysophospholipase L1-like esterase
LIGVNDLVQGRTAEQYRKSLQAIYGRIAALNLPAGRIAAVSIPAWSFVPAAADFGGSDRVGRMTLAFNEVARGEAAARGFEWIDITEASRSGIGSPGWIASDRLHPGDRQYAAWAEVIWQGVQDTWTTA